MAYFKTIPFSSIVFPATNLASRPCPTEKDKIWPKFLEFCEDIANRGVLNTPTVRVEGDKFCVMDGHRRFHAILRLVAQNDQRFLSRYPDGFPVRVDEVSDIEGLGNQIAANYQNERQAPASLAKAIYKYISASPDKTLADVARSVGYTEPRLVELLRLNHLPENVQTLVDSKTINIGNAIQLTKLPEGELDQSWIDDATVMTQAEFTAKVANRLNEIRAEKRADSEGKAETKQFTPTASVLKKDELGVLFEQAKGQYAATPNDYNKGFLDAMLKIFSLDEVSVAKARSDWEKAQADAEAKKAERKAKRDEEKLAEAKALVAAAEAAAAGQGINLG